MRSCLIVILLCLFGVPAAYAADGVVTVKSHHSVKATADRLEDLLREKGMKVFARINHAAGAETIGQTLRPTELLLFGNPRVGTPLMKCAQRIGLDLPQKALIWQDRAGQVWLAYNDPTYLANRHGIVECAKMIPKVKKALKGFSMGATKP